MTITGINYNMNAYMPGASNLRMPGGVQNPNDSRMQSGVSNPNDPGMQNGVSNPNDPRTRSRVIGSDEPKTRAEAADPDKKKKAGRKSSPEECETCKHRKYQDGSDENVSFKSAAHISPQAAGAAVRAHENEHVNNAYKKAAKDNGEVISANVSIHMSVCPECGRSYVSGGTTNTMIRYRNEENPYQKELKSADAIRLRGANLDLTA